MALLASPIAALIGAVAVELPASLVFTAAPLDGELSVPSIGETALFVIELIGRAEAAASVDGAGSPFAEASSAPLASTTGRLSSEANTTGAVGVAAGSCCDELSAGVIVLAFSGACEIAIVDSSTVSTEGTGLSWPLLRTSSGVAGVA
jgi:hypothetical protein